MQHTKFVKYDVVLIAEVLSQAATEEITNNDNKQLGAASYMRWQEVIPRN